MKDFFELREGKATKTEDKGQFIYAAKQAKAKGDKTFVFAGKTYNCEEVLGELSAKLLNKAAKKADDESDKAHHAKNRSRAGKKYDQATKFHKGAKDARRRAIRRGERVFVNLSEAVVSRSDFDKIKKGDVIDVVFDSSMKKGHKAKLKVKSKTRSAKYNVDKVNMVDANDPRNKTQFTFFSRQGKDATLGWGGMGVALKSYTIGK